MNRRMRNKIAILGLAIGVAVNGFVGVSSAQAAGASVIKQQGNYELKSDETLWQTDGSIWTEVDNPDQGHIVNFTTKTSIHTVMYVRDDDTIWGFGDQVIYGANTRTMSGTNNGHRVKSTASSNPLSITDATGSYKPDGVYIWYTNSLSSGGDQENIDWSTDSTHYSFVDASLSLVESPMTLYTVTDLAETVPVDAGVQQAGGTDSDDQTAEQNTLVSLVAGSLTLTHSADSINFGSLKLDGNSHNLSASSGHFDVADATGSGNGWHVTVAATQFTDSSTGDTLPAGSLTLRQPTVSGVDGAETTGITINDPGTVDMTPGNEVPVASAATGTGMGKYEFAQDSSAGNDGATLNVPANAKAGSFDSMLTYKVTTGP